MKNLDRYSEIDRDMRVLESQIGPLSDFGRDEKNPKFVNLMYNIEKLRLEKKLIYDKLSKAEEFYTHDFIEIDLLRQNQKTPEDIEKIKNYEKYITSDYMLISLVDFERISKHQDKDDLIKQWQDNYEVKEKEIRQLKEELDLERSKKGKYTKFSGGHRANSCEFEVHGSKCEHGDCDCSCHDGEQDNADKIRKYDDIMDWLKQYEIESLFDLQKVFLGLPELKRKNKKLAEENKRLGRFRTEYGIHELEIELQTLKNKIKHHVEVRAGETVFTVWRRELLEIIK